MDFQTASYNEIQSTVSVKEIAKYLGLSQGNIYVSFEKKIPVYCSDNLKKLKIAKSDAWVYSSQVAETAPVAGDK